MFDHIGITASDIEASKSFYLRALAPLGVTLVMEFSGAIGIGRNQKASLWLSVASGKPNPLHIAFVADTREQVRAFYAAALAAGARDNGAPGIRLHYHANYYGAFVIGPDGHNIEAVCHKPEA